jgi:hypothetical protein
MKKKNHKSPIEESSFNISLDASVVTSTYVTKDLMPILYVSHEDDDEGGSLWQFHCGNDDYDMAKMQLVRLDTILSIDKTLIDVATLPKGYSAKRDSKDAKWKFYKE